MTAKQHSGKQWSEQIAVIGCGNLGAALVRGFCERLGVPGSSIAVCDHDSEKVQPLKNSYSLRSAATIAEAVNGARIILIAVKPKTVAEVLQTVKEAVGAQSAAPLIISVAAGVTIKDLRRAAGERVRIVRVMPNVASLIGEGVSGIFGEQAEDVALAERLFKGIGETIVCSQESELDVVTALGAGAPAFIFVAIDALADGGVRMGLTREQALRFAAVATRGAAALVLETGKHPGELKDMVASPGGTTIAGLHVLEKNGFRGTLISAIEASTKRAIEFHCKGGKE